MRIPLTREQKEAVRERDLKKCVRCGTPGKRKNRLTIHHRNHDPSDNRLENLEVLCQRCHTKWHKLNG